MGDWHNHTMTPRLRAHGFEWGIPSKSPDGRRRLERGADEILRKAHSFITTEGRMQHDSGKRVLSLNPDILESEAPEDWESWSEDVFDEFVSQVSWIAALTPSETEIVQLIAQSTIQIGAYGGYEAAALHLDKRINTVRVTWFNAKTKLLEHWAEEPEERAPRQPLRSSIEGNGHTVFIGKPVNWGPMVSPEDAAEAYRNRALNEISDSDWNYRASLTEDGWQLGDDHFWATALDAPWRSDLGF